MRRQSGRTRWLKNRCQRLWFYPRCGSRRAQQGKAPRGKPLNSIRLPCTKSLKASDRTNPSGPYYKDMRHRTDKTKKQKRAPWVRRHVACATPCGSRAISLSASQARQSLNLSGPSQPLVLRAQTYAWHIHIHIHVKTNPASLPVPPSPSSTNPCSPSQVPNSREGPAAEDAASQ